MEQSIAVGPKKTAKTTDIAVRDDDFEVGESRSLESQPSFFERCLNKIQLNDTSNDETCRWTNSDLEPTPPEGQTWGSMNFVTYWLCDALSPGNLRLGSSIVTLGLSWRSAVGIIALGHGLVALAITANGIIGARLHIPYTIQSRAPFGFYASFLVVAIRMVVGVFWYGINTYNGALCVRAVLLAIWPSFANLENTLPEGANITTQTMIGESEFDYVDDSLANDVQRTSSTF